MAVLFLLANIDNACNEAFYHEDGTKDFVSVNGVVIDTPDEDELQQILKKC